MKHGGIKVDAVKKEVIELVHKELESANKKFPMFKSMHEGYAVLKEEVEEAKDDMEWCEEKLKCAWELIKKNDDVALEEVEFLKEFAVSGAIELIQVAAMAQKFIDSKGDHDESTGLY